MNYLVISYDDDQQQTFFDNVIADTPALAKERIGKLRDYAIPCDVLTEDDLRTMAFHLNGATPESVADAQEAILTELGKFECRQFEMEEVNYGGYDTLQALAKGGIVFTGSHGEGGGYCAHEFCSTGNGEHYEMPSVSDLGPVVPIDKDGNVPPDSLARAQRHMAAEREVEAYFERIRLEFDAAQATQNALTEA